jgi:serine protease inhibitor
MRLLKPYNTFNEQQLTELAKGRLTILREDYAISEDYLTHLKQTAKTIVDDMYDPNEELSELDTINSYKGEKLMVFRLVIDTLLDTAVKLKTQWKKD